MRIAFYIPQLSTGGAERVVANLANTLNLQGHEITIITTVRHKNEYEVSPDIHRYVLDEMFVRRNKYFNKYNRFKSLRNICRNNRIDILVAFLSGAVNYSIYACLGLKTKVIISERNSPTFTYPTKFKQLYARILLPLADGAVFQTEDAQKWFPLRLQKKSVVIPNPIKESFYKVVYSPIKNNIVSAGRLTEQKNYPNLINAFSMVVEQRPEVKLHIYGEGELRKELQELIDNKNLSSNIFLEGRVEDISLILKEASLFVMSSDVEGMPNALMEAMAVGVPAVSTDCPCGGPKMLLSEGRGLLVPVGDSVLLSKSILELLNDEEKRNVYSAKGKSFVKQFAPDNITIKWINFFNYIMLHD